MKRQIPACLIFNYPGIDWKDRTAHLTKAHHFLNVMQDNVMSQVVEAPTTDHFLLDLDNTELIR